MRLFGSVQSRREFGGRMAGGFICYRMHRRRLALDLHIYKKKIFSGGFNA
jgi:hypothetical protein